MQHIFQNIAKNGQLCAYFFDDYNFKYAHISLYIYIFYLFIFLNIHIWSLNGWINKYVSGHFCNVLKYMLYI